MPAVTASYGKTLNMIEFFGYFTCLKYYNIIKLLQINCVLRQNFKDEKKTILIIYGYVSLGPSK